MTPDRDIFHDWRSSAACATAPDPDAFHPRGGGSTIRTSLIRNYCGRCPVARACGEFAARTGSSGVWGPKPTTGRPAYASTLAQERRARVHRQIRELSALGRSLSEVARETGVTARTVSRVLARAKEDVQ